MDVANVINAAILIISAVVAIIGLKTIIAPIYEHCKEKQLSKAKKQIKEINAALDQLSSQSFALLSKTNFIGNPEIEKSNLISNYRMKNNMGLYYLEKSRICNDQEFKRKYLHHAIELLNDALDDCCHANTRKKVKPLRPLGNVDIIHVNLADAYHDNQQQDEAIKQCKQALDINPNSAQAYNLLASIYLQQSITDSNKLSDAKENAKKALEKDDNNGFTHLTYAEILIQEGYDTCLQEIVEHINKSLCLACPVWEYTGNPRYSRFKETPDWVTIQNEIDKHQHIHNIATACLQSEHEYII